MRYLDTRVVPLADLRHYPGNARLHDLDTIEASIKANGQYRSLIVRAEADGGMTILAGNGTAEVLRDRLGEAEARCELIEVDDAEAKRINLVDNRANDKAGYDNEALLALLKDTDDLVGTGYIPNDLADLERLLEEQRRADEQLADPDATPPPPAKPITKPGDVWILGPHRLVCGDATDPEVYRLLLADGRPTFVLADPPYGMRLDTDFSTIKGSMKAMGRGKTSGKAYAPVIGDHEDFDPAPVMAMFGDVREQFWFGADYYADRIPDRGAGSWLVWDKRRETQSEAVGSEFELCWSRERHKRRMLRHDWFGFLSSENGAEARNRVHPTQKPTSLLRDIIDQWAKAGAIVLDPYAGSGSTLIACHQTGRVARLVEIDPIYCDVIGRRYQTVTGDVPILERNGKPVRVSESELCSA